MAGVYLGLGSNVGARRENLKRALQALERKVDVKEVSSIYETEPVEIEDQRWFLNAVCAAETGLSPQELRDFVKGIEAEMGRQPGVRFGPRLIDIDILFYDDVIVDEPKLQVPHPRLEERAFVLIPLAEIAPDLVHPALKSTVGELLDALGDPKEVRRVEERR